MPIWGCEKKKKKKKFNNDREIVYEVWGGIRCNNW